MALERPYIWQHELNKEQDDNDVFGLTDQFSRYRSKGPVSRRYLVTRHLGVKMVATMAAITT